MTIEDQAWHVIRQLQVLADHERIPWYLPSLIYLGDYLRGDDFVLDVPANAAVHEMVNRLLSEDALAKAAGTWWRGVDPLRYQAARLVYRLERLGNAEGVGLRTVQSVALNLALQGKFEDLLTYLLGAWDATGSMVINETRRAVKDLVRP